MATKKLLVDIEDGEIKFWVHDDEVFFYVCKTKKEPIDLVVYMIDIVDEGIDLGSSQI